MIFIKQIHSYFKGHSSNAFAIHWRWSSSYWMERLLKLFWQPKPKPESFDHARIIEQPDLCRRCCHRSKSSKNRRCEYIFLDYSNIHLMTRKNLFFLTSVFQFPPEKKYERWLFASFMMFLKKKKWENLFQFSFLRLF